MAWQADPFTSLLVMSDKNTKKGLTSSFSGFSTGTGLRLWLFFLFSFYFLGYPVPLCILLGFTGGLAGGWVVGWWKSSEGPIEAPPVEEQEFELVEDRSSKAGGLRLAKQRREARSRRRSQGYSLPFSNFLRR